MRFSHCQKLRLIADRAVNSLLEEVALSPKPGLVDLRGSGSHTDMNVDLMEKSALCLRDYFYDIADCSWGRKLDQTLRLEIAKIGMAAEKHMLETTGGINTHKGAIWSLGLSSSVLAATKLELTKGSFFSTIARLASMEFKNKVDSSDTDTHGKKVKKLYGLSGAKEEAEQGFPHICFYGLPVLEENKQKGYSKNLCGIHSLLSIMASLDDTCVAYRGGHSKLKKMQRKSIEVLRLGGLTTSAGFNSFEKLDDWIKNERLSPGGAADLLATTLFVDSFNLSN